ncbi:MAG: hypothetical protein DI537_51955 [Stutzerimonas stutzeri]|nr:MAG: hypothetical protein DI537_51955 [Stutzerimonas stutzeri]
MMRVLEGKTVFVCVDSDEDVYLLIADDDAVEKYREENPSTDQFACANAVGRELTAEEQAALPNLEGALTY